MTNSILAPVSSGSFVVLTRVGSSGPAKDGSTAPSLLTPRVLDEWWKKASIVLDALDQSSVASQQRLLQANERPVVDFARQQC